MMGYFAMPPLNASADELVSCAEQNLRLWHQAAKENGGYAYLLDMAARNLSAAASVVDQTQATPPKD